MEYNLWLSAGSTWTFLAAIAFVTAFLLNTPFEPKRSPPEEQGRLLRMLGVSTVLALLTASLVTDNWIQAATADLPDELIYAYHASIPPHGHECS